MDAKQLDEIAKQDTCGMEHAIAKTIQKLPF